MDDEIKLPPVPHGAVKGSLMYEEFTRYARESVRLNTRQAEPEAYKAQQQGEAVAWGLFAKIECGGFHLQHPVRFTEEDAKSDRLMYEPSTAIEIRPLYTHPAPAQQPLIADPFTYIIQHLNSNPYALTKDECITLIKELRDRYAAHNIGAKP